MDDATFQFLRAALAEAFENVGSRIRQCAGPVELKLLLNNQADMCSVWLDRLADSLIASGIVVGIKDAFMDGLRGVGVALAALGPKALQGAYSSGGLARVMENVVCGIGRALFEAAYHLVKMLHESIMALLKVGAIVACKGASGVLKRSYWHWLTPAGAVAGAACAFAFPAVGLLAAVATGATLVTAAVGVLRWAKGE